MGTRAPSALNPDTQMRAPANKLSRTVEGFAISALVGKPLRPFGNLPTSDLVEPLGVLEREHVRGPGHSLVSAMPYGHILLPPADEPFLLFELVGRATTA